MEAPGTPAANTSAPAGTQTTQGNAATSQQGKQSGSPQTQTTTNKGPAAAFKEIARAQTAPDKDKAAWEAEYKAKMAAIRGEADAPKKKPVHPDIEDTEASDEILSSKSETEEKTAAEKWKLKVEGKDVEYDPANVEQTKFLVQKALGLDKKLSHLDRQVKQAEQFIEGLRQNPFAYLEHQGLLGAEGARAAAEQYLLGKVRHEMLPPEERQIMSEREELARLREERQQQVEAQKEQRINKLKEVKRQEFSTKIVNALQEAKLPNSDWTVRRMADYMRQGLKQGLKDIQPSDVAHLVRNDWLKAQKDLVSKVDPETLVSMLGEDAVNKIRQHTVKQYNQTKQQAVVVSRDGSQPQRSSQVRYSTPEEMRDALLNRR